MECDKGLRSDVGQLDEPCQREGKSASIAAIDRE
jgi:hypothetical protein